MRTRLLRSLLSYASFGIGLTLCVFHARADDLSTAGPAVPDTAAIAPKIPAKTWAEEVREQGRPLLEAEKWDEAAEHFGTAFHQLAQEAYSTQQRFSRRTDVAPSERDRFNRAIISFYFRQVHFPWINIHPQMSSAEELARSYVKSFAAIPEGEPRLDVSHVDLLTEMVAPPGKTPPLPSDYLERIKAALKANPESIPASLALMYYWERTKQQPDRFTLADARQHLKGNYGRLCLVRMASMISSHDKDAADAPAILRENWDLLPSAEAKVHTLLRWAEVEPAEELNIYLAALKKLPHAKTTGIVRERACGALIEKKGTAAAEAFIANQENAGHREGLDRALFALSTAFFSANDAKSEELLLKILKEYPDTTTASRAMVGLAEVYAKRKDVEQEIEWLRKCVDFEKTEPTATNIMDTDNTRSVAIQRLAARMEDRGQWKEALALWTAWQPRSWCGTCKAQMQSQRTAHLVQCHGRLGSHAAAAQEAWSATTSGSISSSRVLAWSLYQLYRDAGQLEDLRSAVAKHQQKTLADWKAKGYFPNHTPDQLASNQPTYLLSTILSTGEMPSPDKPPEEKFDWPKPKKGSLPKLTIEK